MSWLVGWLASERVSWVGGTLVGVGGWAVGERES